MSFFNITTLQNGLPQKKLYFHLYLHHTYSGSSTNQAGVISANLPNRFGNIVINDWPMTEGLAPTTTVIARAQGLHIQAGMIERRWYNSLNIVFEDARFKGSTLAVMGPVVENGDWAIVGGTGEFTLAQGVIYKKTVQSNNEGNIIELDIHAFYAPFEKANWA